MSELQGLQSRIEDFRAAGAAVVAVSSSSPAEHQRVIEKLGLSFPVLSDVTGAEIERWGLLHPGALPFSDTPVSRPAVFILDSERRVRERLLTDNWRVRVRADDLLETLRRLQSLEK